ncbi:MAG: hypothetical protein CO096_11440 [Armatimonadetes bacterium CG_4_9_14_3_um_filter_66_14]|nr:MAG: hypothetical protein CO096_11440 [Armatimonadetes bacterium CG_4_9_14_3_um_filter_66_14]
MRMRTTTSLLPLLGLLAGVCSAAEFHVSLTGGDTGPGTKQRPFATLSRAQEAARQARAQGDKAVRVTVRGGVYFLAESLTLEPQDSGLTIEGAKGEEVVWSAATLPRRKAMASASWAPARTTSA